MSVVVGVLVQVLALVLLIIFPFVSALSPSNLILPSCNLASAMKQRAVWEISISFKDRTFKIELLGNRLSKSLSKIWVAKFES